MAEAIDLAKLHGQEPVERALAACAPAGRFADGDLQAILAHQQQQAVVVPLPLRASDESSLQRSTRSMGGVGKMNTRSRSRTETDAQGGDRRPAGTRRDRSPDRIRSTNTRIGGRR